MEHNFYSRGKLLITGEYLVLDGALALALPTKLGQSLSVTPISDNLIEWISFDHQKKSWFQHNFILENKKIRAVKEKTTTEEKKVSKKLEEIFSAIIDLKPELLTDKGYRFQTDLDFPRNWGLGTSSTLINNLAQWGKINPYKLLELTFGGSGYDIACANSTQALFYQRKGRNSPHVEAVNFNPPFKDKLFFVYLNRKQDSRKAIQHYQAQDLREKQTYLTKVSEISKQIIECDKLENFEKLIDLHEELLSKILNLSPIKNQLFPDFKNSIKSLGGWGGDFILATGGKEEQTYFKEKGFPTILSYEELIFHK